MALTTPNQSLVLSEGIALARQLAFDLDPLNYALSDAQWTVEANNVYEVWYEANNKRPVQLNGSAAFGNTIGTQTTPGRSGLSGLTNVLRWTNLYLVGASNSGPDLGTELEILNRANIIAAQVELQQGTPIYGYVERLSDTSSNLALGKWGLYLAPMPTTALYVAGFALVSPGLYSAASADVIDCNEAESRIVWTAAAARVCERLGKPGAQVNGLWRMVPSDTQAILRGKADNEPSPKVQGQ